MRTVFLGLIGSTWLFVASAYAQEQLAADLDSANAESFKVFDADADGKATPAEIIAGAKTVFTALDANSDGAADEGEFQVFSMGYEPLAQQLIRGAEYKAARTAIFTRWDMNGDKQLSEAEIATSLLAETMSAANASVDLPAYATAQFIAEMGASLK